MSAGSEEEDGWVGVTLELPGGRQRRLSPGQMIGRGRNADLQLPDPQISVAHAGIGLRAGQLWLLAYRGRVWVDGVRKDDVALRRHMRLELAPGVWFKVHEVHLPPLVTLLAVDDVEIAVDQSMWHLDAEGVLRPGPDDERLTVWEAHGSWFGRAPGMDAPLTLAMGVPADLGGHRVRVDIATPAAASTQQTVEELPPIEVHSHFDETEIVVGKRAPVRLRRRSHEVVRALGRLTAATGRPVHWLEVAETVWTFPNQQERLSTLWAQKRARLHEELQAERLPTWLVRTDGGLVQLGLRREDRFYDCDPHT